MEAEFSTENRPLRYGSWTAMEDIQKTPKGEIKRLCRCDCGTERYVLERALRSGASKSCGCLRKKRSREALAYDLSGKTFGDLTVLGPGEKRERGGLRWKCRCSCGRSYETSSTLLVTGKRTHCGGPDHQKNYAYSDITGKKFHSLTALYPLKERDPKGSVIWHCRCDCGKETDISYNTLMYTAVKSCGCRKKAHDQKLGSFLTHVGGTSIDILKSEKVPANNTTGAKGVYFIKGRYVAKIVFQKKQYFLGAFDTFAEAAAVRAEAENVIQETVVGHYEAWKARADREPEWALANPVRYQMEKTEDHQLRVTCLPPLTEVCGM